MSTLADGNAARVKGAEIRNNTELELEKAKSELARVSELFHDFLVKLKAHDTDTCHSCVGFGHEFTKILDDCPGVRSWFEVYKTTKAKADQELRDRALSRMSQNEARALGLLAEWDIHRKCLVFDVPAELKKVKAAPATDQELIDGLRTYGAPIKTNKPGFV